MPGRPLLPLFLALFASPALAGEITFDELAPSNSNLRPLKEEYAALGVHFVTTDDGSTWGGRSGGDRGNWGLEGTAGPVFLGFNGRSYRASVRFDAPVAGAAVDVAASYGGSGSVFALEGWRAGALVETQAVTLGALDEWQTVELAGELDTLVLVGTGTGVHPFGVDHLRWDLEPPVLDVDVDVRPGNARNPVNPLSRGVVPVAILGDEEFDVRDVNPASLACGEAPVAERPAPQLVDVDDDGDLDLGTHCWVKDTGLAFGDSELCLYGETWDAQALEGCDEVVTVPGASAARARR
jgi:hypothetical protein